MDQMQDVDVAQQFKDLSDACHTLSEAFIKFSAAAYSVGRSLEDIKDSAHPTLFTID